MTRMLTSVGFVEYTTVSSNPAEYANVSSKISSDSFNVRGVPMIMINKRKNSSTQ